MKPQIRIKCKDKQKGVAVVSYVLGLMALLTGLLAPVFNNKSAVQLLVEAVKEDYAGYEYAVSGKGDIEKWKDYLIE